jgi:PKD repeat protein
MKTLTLIFLLLHAYSALAYSPSCSKDGTVVVYSNGLDSSRRHTIDGRDKLKAQAGFLNNQIDKGAENPKKPNHVRYEFHHNARFQDMDEASLLSRYRDFVSAAAYLVKTKAKQDFNLTLDEEKQLEFIKKLEGFNLDSAPQGGSYTAVFNFLLEWYAQYLAGEIENSIQANPQENARLLTEIYRRHINSGKRVLAVVHGEGSIINSAAFDLAFDSTFEIIGLPSEVNAPDQKKKQFFSTIQISPASHLISQGTYRTYDQDKYYNDIYSKLNFSAPASNFSYYPVPLVGEQWLHDFSKTYMAIGVRGGQYSSDYFGTLGGVIEAAEMLESTCGKPPVAFFNLTSQANPHPNSDPMTFDFDGSISKDEDTPVVDPNKPAPIEPPDYDIDPNGFEWLIDGRDKLVGMKPAFTFENEGQHTVQLIVTDLEGNKSEPLIVPIYVFNQAPTANFLFEVDGLKVSFDALDSYDLDGKIITYFWDFGDGLYSSEKTPTHTYLLPGTYSVTLKVTDNNGKAGTIQYQVEVKGAAVGCFKNGQYMPGKKHLNPDGSMGGFVANTATVSPTVTLYGGEICEASQISGNVIMYSGKITGNSIISGAMTINESTINNSNLTSTSGASIYSVTMNDSTITARGFSIGESEFSAVVANIRDMSVGRSTMKNSSFSGDLSISESKVYDSSLSSLSLRNSFIQYSTMIGSSVYESHVESSTVTGSSIFYSTLINMTLNGQSCMSVSVSGGTTCPPPVFP